MDDKAIKSFMLTNVDRYIRVHFARWLVASFFDPVPVSLFFPGVFENERQKRIAKGIQSCLAVSFQTSKALVKAFFPTKTCHHFLVGYTPLTGSETRKPVHFSVKQHHHAKNSYLYTLSNKFRLA